MMQITVSCAERFHSYNLADQFNRVGVLKELITTYPKSEVMRYGVPREKIHTYLWWEILKRSWAKLSQFNGIEFNSLIAQFNQVYDTVAAHHLNSPLDFFIGWSGRSEKQLVKAKGLGAVGILERGSSHIEIQSEILREEYEQYFPAGLKNFTPVRVIEKEVREYAIADYISVPSTFVKNTFIQKGFSPDKIIQNAYGVDLRQFSPGGKPDAVFRVIHVGQLSLRKGVHYLLEAFDKLNLPNAELMFVGGKAPEIEPFLKKYNRNIRYMGIHPQHELYKFYRQASVFTLCSIEEGMAMVQAQAAACGLPILCTTNTGGEDLIEEGKQGFVIPIRNVDAIKEKLEWMYTHAEETKRMGVMAREKVANGFSWNDYGDRYVNNLQRILQRRGQTNS